MVDFKKINVGILALQGDYELHQKQLNKLRVTNKLIKLPDDFKTIDGLIIPGGESTTMNTLIDRFNLRDTLKNFCKTRPVYGTCAGMILLAAKIEQNQSNVKSLGILDIDVIRTGYGRQIYSIEEKITVDFDNEKTVIKVAFIRAPIITRLGEQVKTLAVYGDKPVLVRQNNILAASFHAELNDDTTLLEYFLRNLSCQTYKK